MSSLVDADKSVDVFKAIAEWFEAQLIMSVETARINLHYQPMRGLPKDSAWLSECPDLAIKRLLTVLMDLEQ